MTTTESAPETAVDRTKVNVAADCEANRTKNFASRPMTGDEYIESLRDDREIYLYGERVEGRHHPPGVPQPGPDDRPALRRACTTGEHVDALTTPTDTGNGGVTHAVLPDPAQLGGPAEGPRRDRRPGRG